jgi:hypothetical protein
MNRLEEELKKALQRVEPPPGFAQRVLAKAAKREQEGKRTARFWFAWLAPAGLRWASAAALCLVLASSGLLYRHEERKRGEAAKEQLMLALRITSSKLQIVTQNVRELNSAEQPQP